LQAPPDLKIGPNKFQITMSKSAGGGSKSNFLVRLRRICYCNLPFAVAQGGELVESFGIFVLLFEIF
jgi:hypothetical protein